MTPDRQDDHDGELHQGDADGRPVAPVAGCPAPGAGAIRRRRWGRAATVTGSLVVLSFSGQSTLGAPAVTAVPMEGFLEAGVRGNPLAVDAAAVREGLVAAFEGVELVNPAPAATILGFHEAAGSGPLPLRPAYIVEDHNPQRTKPVALGRAPGRRGLELIVLPSRGRASDATTALDVAVPAGQPIHSPVSGTVRSVDRYVLYGQHEDHIIEISPDGRPDLAVKLVHLVAPEVEVGQRVEAGRTPIAGGAGSLPFPSQIDRFTEERGVGVGPHVHIEVIRVAG